MIPQLESFCKNSNKYVFVIQKLYIGKQNFVAKQKKIVSLKYFLLRANNIIF